MPTYTVQDGLRLLIQFANHGEYELDANTQDEKNQVEQTVFHLEVYAEICTM